MCHALAATAVAVLWCAPQAHGAAVSLTSDKYSVFEWLVVKAGSGESNDVTLKSEGDSLTVIDAGARLSSHDSTCTEIDPHTVECSRADAYGSFNGAIVTLRGGDDRLDAAAFDSGVHALGGAGRDELHGGRWGDSLRGGGGHDTLDGGPGRDEAEFHEGIDGLRVDLADSRPQGAPGSEDVLRDIEDIEAKEGADVLGDAGPNTLTAGPNARINGRGGNDSIFVAWAGRALGGRGDDELSLATSGKRTGPIAYACGPGDDVVSVTRLTDTVESGCETVDPSEMERAYEDFRTRLASRRVATARLDCAWTVDRRQRFEVTIRRGSPTGPVITRRDFAAECPGGSKVVHRFPLRLSPSAWRTLREERALRVVISSREVLPGDRYGGPPEGFSAVLRAGAPPP